MPLVIVSGHPCVGKTTFANNLLNKLKLVKDPSKIFLINEESLHYEREEFYQGTISSFSSLFSSSYLCPHLSNRCITREDSQTGEEYYLTVLLTCLWMNSR
jgi:broad-specificity NMP kinase